MQQTPLTGSSAAPLRQGARWLWLLFLLWPLGSASAEPRPSAPTQIYMPFVTVGDTFGAVPAIWAAGEPAAAHEVLLFRHRFRVDQPLASATLRVFADTRYELWLDGVWQGRGPARFSATTHEYDLYELGALAPGEHVVAVQVQWSPNTRRSASSTPHLRASLHSSAAGERRPLWQTGPTWRALRSDAWRSDAALVHAWGLVGATELLDFRRLPAQWAAPTFDDGGWPLAVVRPVPPTHDSPRSIPMLAEVAMPVTLHERGWLSPGEQLVELPPSEQGYLLPLMALQPTTLTIRLLPPVAPALASLVQLDGEPLAWGVESAGHPDLRLANRALAPGSHTLAVAPAAEGLTLALSTAGLAPASWPFEPGNHAGRRTLVAQPQPAPEAVALLSATPLTLRFDGGARYALLDVGRTVHGRVVAEVGGPAGTVVDIGWDERLWQGRRPLPFPGSLHQPWNQVDSWQLDGSTRTLTTIDARAGRYLLIAVWGEGPVTLSNIRVYEERLPTTQVGTFHSADSTLDKIWQVGVESLYPNMTDAYTDTPWRERGQWWGDAFVSYHVNRVSLGDEALFRRALLSMGEAIGPGGEPAALAPYPEGTQLLDYGMLWVQGLRRYDDQVADRRLLEASAAPLWRLMGHLESKRNPQSGLLDLPKVHWSQSALLDWLAFHSRYGQSTALNAMYSATLQDAAAIAARLGDEQQAALWAQQATALRQQINSLLYDPVVGSYATTLYQGQRQPPSVHAQAWALAYDVVPQGERARVADALLAQVAALPVGKRVEGYGFFWLLEGLARADRIPQALALLDEEYGRLLALGATTWWETLDSNERYDGSLSHAWSGAPTWFLTTHLLGLQRTGPNAWEARPALAGTTWAEGALPVQGGVVQLRWEMTSACGQWQLSVVAPAGSSGTLWLPAGAETASSAGGVARPVVLSEGEHLFQGLRSCSEAASAERAD